MSVPEAPQKSHYLFPGELFAQREPHLVSTVLGSCISVCLWDPGAGIGGINHFLLPLWNGEGLPTPKYGNVAIPRLWEKMISLGCVPSRIQAKVFGGSAMWNATEGLLAVGVRNIELADNMLRDMGIPVISKDVGGTQSRKIIFHTADGTVMLRRHNALAAQRAAESG